MTPDRDRGVAPSATDSWAEALRQQLVAAAQREVDRDGCRRGRLRDRTGR